jgi:hypothetical protein
MVGFVGLCVFIYGSYGWIWVCVYGFVYLWFIWVYGFMGWARYRPQKSRDHIKKWSKIFLRLADIFRPHQSDQSEKIVCKSHHMIILKDGRKLTISFSGHALSTYYADIRSERWLTMKGYNLWLVTWSARLDPLLIGWMGTKLKERAEKNSKSNYTNIWYGIDQAQRRKRNHGLHNSEI